MLRVHGVWKFLERWCGLVRNTIKLWLLIERLYVSPFSRATSFGHWIDRCFWIFLDESLSRRFQHFSALNRPSYNSLVDFISDSLSLMLKHWLWHVGYWNLRLLWGFISINRSLLFFYNRSHSIWWNRPWPCESVWILRERSHSVSDYAPLHGLMNLVLKVLVRSLRPLCIADESGLDPRILFPWNRLVIISEGEILLLDKIISWRGSLLLVISPVARLLNPITPWPIIGLLNTDVWIRRSLIDVLWKIVSDPLVLGFCINWLEMLKLALGEFLCHCYLFLMHFELLNDRRVVLLFTSVLENSLIRIHRSFIALSLSTISEFCGTCRTSEGIGTIEIAISSRNLIIWRISIEILTFPSLVKEFLKFKIGFRAHIVKSRFSSHFSLPHKYHLLVCFQILLLRALEMNLPPDFWNFIVVFIHRWIFRVICSFIIIESSLH